MKKSNNNLGVDNQVKKFQLNITISYIVLIVLVVSFLSFFIMKKSRDTVSSEISGLISANSRQIELNISSYLKDVESTVALLFSDEAYYLYDATNSKYDDYDKIQYENGISNRIVDLGLMQNYADFYIVYPDDHTVGWLSKTTQNLYSKGGMYDSFASLITNDKTNDAWYFGLEDNYDRMYYAKRLNPNAILVCSFYGTELNTAFQYPDELEGMTIHLVDDKKQIVFSSDKEQIGTLLSEDISDIIYTNSKDASSSNSDASLDNNNQFTNTTVSATTKHMVVNTNVCANGWLVVCTVSTDIILEDIETLQIFTIIFSSVLLVLAVIIGLIILKRLAKPMDEIVSDLKDKAHFDALSGVLNKASFTSIVNERIGKKKEDDICIFGMLDVDNFKTINDSLGHAHGDNVIKRMGNLLTKTFSDNVTIGRLGGDEFAIFAVFQDKSAKYVHNHTSVRMGLLVDSFALEFFEEHEQCNVSLSAGVSISTDVKAEFSTMYEAADMALYVSKKNGKNQFTVYNKSDFSNNTSLNESSSDSNGNPNGNSNGGDINA